MNSEKKNIKIKFHILAIACMILFCTALAPVTMQNDTYYTIKIGEHITETGTIDMKDTFSWHKDLKYTYPHYLIPCQTFICSKYLTSTFLVSHTPFSER